MTSDIEAVEPKNTEGLAAASAARYAVGRGEGADNSTNAAVFRLEWDGDTLPRVWVSTRHEPPTLESTGRLFLGIFPEDRKVGIPSYGAGDEDGYDGYGEDDAMSGGLEEDEETIGGLDDEDGESGFHEADDYYFDPAMLEIEEAMQYGSQYYDEGMSTSDEAFWRDRVDCFRASEALYLRAARYGELQAFANLGYVYSYDRCEGEYLGVDENGTRIWSPAFGPGAATNDAGTASGVGATLDADGEPFPRERRAYECFKVAADADHPEACYKLGDLVKEGRGCEADAASAVALWTKAFALCRDVDMPVWWGSAALRLGEAYENGEGCPQDFENALKWYRDAENGLRIAVDQGETWYRKALTRARDGVKRCEQEVSGQY
ncbi:MAG: sel1 repeat family protein [Atopobiaceae bacterium]|nr:sel1 repeat family protein [Atopobiaceae bacterium]